MFVSFSLLYSFKSSPSKETEFLNSLTIRILCVALDKPFMHGFKFGKPLKNLTGIFAKCQTTQQPKYLYKIVPVYVSKVLTLP